MTVKPTDLLAIANADLAKKIDRDAQLKEQQEELEKAEQKALNSLQEDSWKAVFVLNVFRYLIAIAGLGLFFAQQLDYDLPGAVTITVEPLFLGSVICLLISAIAFSIISKRKLMEFERFILLQFILDLLLASFLGFSTMSDNSVFIPAYFIIVATGSVVLPRIQALGLAAGSSLLMFYQHFHYLLRSDPGTEEQYVNIAIYSVLLFAVAAIISELAMRLRQAELSRYIPGDEDIGEFLLREEIKALKSALEKTDGNKTEAAKLLGMSFRSFRYKLTKYDID